MKKKIIWIVCAIVIVAALAAMLIFALGGKSGGNAGGSEAAPVDLSGTWKVAAYFNEGQPEIVDNEYMVFADGKAVDYRDGAEYVSSAYSVDAANELSLKDISRTYHLDSKTPNCISLYENPNTYIELIRYPNADMSALSFDAALLSGQWDIAYRRTDKSFDGDYLLFEDGTISQFSASANSIVATADFEVQGNRLVVSAWGKDMVVYPLSDTVILMVELSENSGFIWEIHKAA